MFIVIVGGGKVGTYLARALMKQQHEVVVVEKDARKAQLMTNLLETDVAVVGDGCDPNVLLQAGIARADVVVADTGDDEDNLVVTIISKKHSQARCIARVNNPKNKLIFASLDADRPVTVISSTELILGIIEDRVINAEGLEQLATIGNGELDLVQLHIAEDSPANGKRLADIALPRGSIVVAVDRGGEVVVPHGETTLQRGDDVVAMIGHQQRAAVCAALLGGAVAAR